MLKEICYSCTSQAWRPQDLWASTVGWALLRVAWFVIWEIEGPLLRQVTEIEKEVVIVLLLHFWASNWLRANISQVTQPQPGFTPLAIHYTSCRVLRLNRRSCIFIYLSGWLRWSTLQVQWDGTQGSFRKLHRFDAFKKYFWLWVNIFCEQLRKWSVTSGCCQQRRGLRPGRRHRYLRSGQGLAPFYDIGLYVELLHFLSITWNGSGALWKQEDVESSLNLFY